MKGGKGGGLLALISGGEPSEEMESESDPFEQGFRAFRGALKSGDAMKAKRAFRLMKEACGDEEEDEGDEYEEEG